MTLPDDAYRCNSPALTPIVIESNEKLKRALLWLPAKMYELAVRLRVAAYETGYLKEKRLDGVVISIGNITLGGSGKTPLVEYIARYLKQEDHTVAILTRGYGRQSHGRRALNVKTTPDAATAGARSHREFGDEPVMLAKALPDVPIIIDKERGAAAEWVAAELGSEVFILDDGFQHLALGRDLNLLLLDATDPFGKFEMVPFGRLREPLYGLRRADAVIITRADRPFDQGQTHAIIKHFCGDKIPIMYIFSGIARLRHVCSGELYDAKQFAGWNVALMCGIGNPHAFADDILQAGINIVSENFFPDHHAFTGPDLERILREAKSAGADAIITTEKDAVRIEDFDTGDIPLYAAQLEIQSDDEVRLKSMLLRTVSKR